MKKGTTMTWKNGKPAFVKLGDDFCDWWECLSDVEQAKEKEKRYRFKWTDTQVLEWYGKYCMMTFQTK